MLLLSSLAQSQNTGSLLQLPPPKSKKATSSPEAIQIEFLKKELSIVQTKVTALESELKRKEETCRIQEERIKSLEHPAVTNLLNNYLPKDPPETPVVNKDDADQVLHNRLLQQVISDIRTLSEQIKSIEQHISFIPPPLQDTSANPTGSTEASLSPENSINNEQPEIQISDTPVIDPQGAKSILQTRKEPGASHSLQ